MNWVHHLLLSAYDCNVSTCLRLLHDTPPAFMERTFLNCKPKLNNPSLKLLLASYLLIETRKVINTENWNQWRRLLLLTWPCDSQTFEPGLGEAWERLKPEAREAWNAVNSLMDHSDRSLKDQNAKRNTRGRPGSENKKMPTAGPTLYNLPAAHFTYWASSVIQSQQSWGPGEYWAYDKAGAKKATLIFRD